MNLIENNPLVSIVVVTYNSSKYIVETLESAKKQTYKNIELIISDDCSKDSTQKICRDWISKNKNRFIGVKLVEYETNTGIPANCNRGVNNARGEWIKLIAGDDILDSKCVENLIRFSAFVTEAVVIASRCQGFKNKFSKDNFIKTRDLSASLFFRYDTTATQQFFMLLGYNYIDASATLINKSFLLSSGGFEESFRNIEDLPFLRKTTAMGYKIHFLNEITAYYRFHPEGVSRPSNHSSGKHNYMLLDYTMKMFDKYNKDNITQEERVILVKKYLLLLRRLHGNLAHKVFHFRKIIRYWPGIKYFLNMDKATGVYNNSDIDFKTFG